MPCCLHIAAWAALCKTREHHENTVRTSHDMGEPSNPGQVEEIGCDPPQPVSGAHKPNNLNLNAEFAVGWILVGTRSFLIGIQQLFWEPRHAHTFFWETLKPKSTPNKWVVSFGVLSSTPKGCPQKQTRPRPKGLPSQATLNRQRTHGVVRERSAYHRAQSMLEVRGPNQLNAQPEWTWECLG